MNISFSVDNFLKMSLFIKLVKYLKWKSDYFVKKKQLYYQKKLIL